MLCVAGHGRPPECVLLRQDKLTAAGKKARMNPAASFKRTAVRHLRTTRLRLRDVRAAELHLRRIEDQRRCLEYKTRDFYGRVGCGYGLPNRE